jgi:arsenate reductase (thioredoxin)
MSAGDENFRTLATWLGTSRTPSPERRKPAPLVLFLCRSNTASSIMAEAILEHVAKGRLRAGSAGDSTARAPVNPYALECLQRHGIATRGLRSKPWGEFFGLHRAPVRFLILLSEVEAARVCWELENNELVRSRWNVPDPAELLANDTDVRADFERAYVSLESRIRKFLALPLDQLTHRELVDALGLIGREFS